MAQKVWKPLAPQRHILECEDCFLQIETPKRIVIICPDCEGRMRRTR
jgi:Zn finger protein HypA/HybF involved in hydrogenase expression